MRLSKYTVFGNAGLAAGIISGVSYFMLIKYWLVVQLQDIYVPYLFEAIVAFAYGILIGIAIKLVNKSISYSGILILTIVSIIALQVSGYLAAVIFYTFNPHGYENAFPVYCMFSNAVAGICGAMVFTTLFFFWGNIFRSKHVFKVLPITGGIGGVLFGYIIHFVQKCNIPELFSFGLILFAIGFTQWQVLFSLAMASCLKEPKTELQKMREEIESE